MFDNLIVMSQTAQKKIDGTVQFSDRVADVGARTNFGANVVGGGLGLLIGAIITAPIRGLVSAVTDTISVTAEIVESCKGVSDARVLMATPPADADDGEEDVGVGGCPPHPTFRFFC